MLGAFACLCVCTAGGSRLSRGAANCRPRQPLGRLIAVVSGGAVYTARIGATHSLTAWRQEPWRTPAVGDGSTDGLPCVAGAHFWWVGGDMGRVDTWSTSSGAHASRALTELHTEQGLEIVRTVLGRTDGSLVVTFSHGVLGLGRDQSAEASLTRRRVPVDRVLLRLNRPNRHERGPVGGEEGDAPAWMSAECASPGTVWFSEEYRRELLLTDASLRPVRSVRAAGGIALGVVCAPRRPAVAVFFDQRANQITAAVVAEHGDVGRLSIVGAASGRATAGSRLSRSVRGPGGGVSALIAAAGRRSARWGLSVTSAGRPRLIQLSTPVADFLGNAGPDVVCSRIVGRRLEVGIMPALRGPYAALGVAPAGCTHLLWQEGVPRGH
jgi:hypothetical protein